MTKRPGNIRTGCLRDLGIHPWFAVTGGPGDADTLERMERTLAETSPWPVRVVASRDDVAQGRLGGYCTAGGRLSLWWPTFRIDLAEPERREIAAALIDAAIESSAARWPVRFVESRPAYDVDWHAEWMECLESAGFLRVCQSHVYARATRGPLARGNRLRPAHGLSADALADLVARCSEGTHDRVDALGLQPPEEGIRELLRLSGTDGIPESWWFCEASGRPVGVLFVGVADDDGVTTGTILYIGVDPAHRGKGIGAQLLTEGLSRLEAQGVSAFEAFIDDENIASIRLHERLGFTRQEGAFWHLIRMPPTAPR